MNPNELGPTKNHKLRHSSASLFPSSEPNVSSSMAGKTIGLLLLHWPILIRYAAGYVALKLLNKYEGSRSKFVESLSYCSIGES